jgi:hypothetical protein
LSSSSAAEDEEEEVEGVEWNEGSEGIKDVFDEAAGEEWCKYAYAREYALLRGSFRLGMKGKIGEEEGKGPEEVEKIVGE